ncbi:MAG TPA: hypothetical protein VH475_04425 [Tepidisphaeraceae bacterium]
MTGTDAAAGPDDRLSEFLAGNHITLRIGSEQLAPAAGLLDRVSTAVERANRARRFDQLPDALNAELLDPAKVQAFLRNLPSLDAATIERLRDRVLYLNAPELALGTGSAATAAALSAGYTLSVPAADKGRVVLPRLNCDVNIQAVLSRAADARRAVEQFHRQASQQEDDLQQVDTDQDPQGYVRLANQLGETKYRRAQAAIVWKNLVSAASAANPADRELSTQAAAAAQAAREFAVPPRHGAD